MTTLPLAGLRVLDLTDGLGESSGRVLADLGADVLRVEAPGGSGSRALEPTFRGVSVPFALRNANKRSTVLDPRSDGDRERLLSLLAETDIVIESQGSVRLADLGLGAAGLTERFPGLIPVTISWFGATGPYRDWVGSESVIYAMGGVLSRSGQPGMEPLLPPAGLVEESLGVHTAWSALLAYYQRLHTGVGQSVDISAFEVVTHGFDPGFGVQGSAAAGRSDDYPRGRPDAANFYPVFDCLDGQVRICLLARRQWRGMFDWLGSPEEFADPKFDTIPARFASADRLHPLIQELFNRYTRDELVAEGAARGIPIGGVLAPGEVLTAEHFEVAGTFTETEIVDGHPARVPSGYARINGQRAGFRHRAPAVGEHEAAFLAAAAEQSGSGQGPGPVDPGRAGRRPFEGLRVLDLGVVVFGAELGRQFADQGADVIKVENRDFPDGLRQSKRGAALAASVAWGHRNKRSLGLDLRSPQGKRLFRQLATEADVVLANFKPGTLTSMGFGPDELSALNPNIIVAESSAFGSRGPWNTRLGYGPLVRAAAGVSALWRYTPESTELCDGSTVYPDHIGGQVSAVTILAQLIARRNGAAGAALEVAQADVAVFQLGSTLAYESLSPGSVAPAGNQDPFAAPAGVFACAGDDEWCAVTVRDDRDWIRLAAAIGRDDLASDPGLATVDGRLARRGEVDDALAGWLAEHTPTEAMTVLQRAGVPAGAMMRLPDQLVDPQLTEREAFTDLSHPLLPIPLPSATRVAHFGQIPPAPFAPAPLPGENTIEIASELIGLSGSELDGLVGDGVLQPMSDDPLGVARADA